MANPNIVNVSSILGKTAVAVASTTPTNIISNNTGSNTILKVNVLSISNVSASAATAVASVFRGAVEYKVVHNVVVPIAASLTAIDKPTSIYLEEGDSLRITAGTNSALHAVCSYEIIS
jgi:hypothetical protein